MHYQTTALRPNSILKSMQDYHDLYDTVCQNDQAFWLKETQSRLNYDQAPTIAREGDFHTITQAPIKWFSDGKLNVSVNCVDRHYHTKPNQTAIIWEGDDPKDQAYWTYERLYEEVCQCANALEAMGVKQNDCVMIYMGMVPQAVALMLACARIGAIHSVVFAGFSAQSLKDRIEDCGAKWILSQDEGLRGGKTIPLKQICDEAIALCPPEMAQKIQVLVFQRTYSNANHVQYHSRDRIYQQYVSQFPKTHQAKSFEAEQALFILYTSGSTGKPKGLLHTSAGYLTYVSYTHQLVFDYQPGDIYACMADIGWITGHSYIVYGPLANGATTFMFESTPLYPNASRYWEMVDRHQINIFYTAPTAIRTLASQGNDFVRSTQRRSLRVLGTVGEPINPEAWQWYYQVVGEGKSIVVDTFWQTETGGICISPLASITPTKPGSATLPLPGILPVLLNQQNEIQTGVAEGKLMLALPWPGQARTIYGDHQRMIKTYFSEHQGYYFTGDGAKRDEDGYYWITGRIDDVINVSGHRMGTAEFESAIASHPSIAECSVVGYPHEIKGQGVCAYVVLKAEVLKAYAQESQQGSQHQLESLEKSLQALLKESIGSLARIDRLLVIPGLPKTRSGKIMRRILRKVAEGEYQQIGDITTLADPSVVQAMIQIAQAQAQISTKGP